MTAKTADYAEHQPVGFLDQAGTIVGLKAKGQAKKDTTGFVIRTAAEKAPAPKPGATIAIAA